MYSCLLVIGIFMTNFDCECFAICIVSMSLGMTVRALDTGRQRVVSSCYDVLRCPTAVPDLLGMGGCCRLDVINSAMPAFIA